MASSSDFLSENEGSIPPGTTRHFNAVEKSYFNTFVV